VAIVLALLAAPAGAQGPLADPTRPPAFASQAEGDGEAGAAGLRAETIIVAPDRRFAVVGGRTVRLGDELGGGRVVRIAADGVVIARGGVRETISIAPGVEKKPRVPRTARKGER